ncbi:PREDICTED: uncharacterized protein LOC109166481 [Ipomoea nil]|uniref:uncharacterized protein LOC109166481 n=1 Tax=Ipomoea nil TaxID=35883 RepID=UPI000901381A|nr:PREDICTED: uncharacterized protein LOC109166481 [Ipomoea nil]
MVASDRFGGAPTEDPNAHIARFLRICKNYFETWDQLHRAFLKRFYPVSKTQKMRPGIQNFKQIVGESLAESWERFKELRRQCPHHGIQSWDFMMAFYEGLLDNSKILVDASSEGSFTVLEPTHAEDLLEKIAMNGTAWYTERTHQRLVGSVDDDSLTAKVDNVATLVRQLAQITLKNQSAGNISTSTITPKPVMMCELCGGKHNTGGCYNIETQGTMEQVDLVRYGQEQQSYPQQGVYNPNAPRNHPGFSWSNPAGAANPQNFGNRAPPPGFQGQQNYRGGNQQQFRPNQGYQAPCTQPRQIMPRPEAPTSSNLEVLMEKLIKSQEQSEERFKHLTKRIDQPSAHNKMLENQIANQASTSSTRVTGMLPASTENSREHVIAIVTRSVKIAEEKIEEILDGVELEPAAVRNNPQVIDEGKKTVRKYENPLPFPLQETKKSRWKKFLEIVENLKVSVPLLDLLSQVPSYGKFLKEILAKMRKYGEHEMIAMAQQYRALTPRVGRRVTKYKDPGKFTIPCIVGGRPIKGSLCDLGASVSVMPLSLYQSTSTVVGILQDVPVRVDKYFVPVDFIVIDSQENPEIPLILGRPFLATARALIDARKGTMILDFGEEKVEFNAFEEKSSCNMVHLMKWDEDNLENQPG